MRDHDSSPLAQADAMIAAAWDRPIEELEALAPRLPTKDPLLRTAMRIRSSLSVLSNSAAVHQERLHALTRPDHIPAFYDLERITESATDLRVAHAECRLALQAIGYVIEAREAAQAGQSAPAARLTQAAVARSVRAPHPAGRLAAQTDPAPVGPPPLATAAASARR